MSRERRGAGVRGRLRQRRFPPEFRIPDAYPPPAAEPVVEEEVPAVNGHTPEPVLAELATNLWRLSRKLDAEQNGEIPRAQRLASRHARAAWDNLADAGVQIQDHDGMAFHPGLSLEVIAYEPRAGVVDETVAETIRPSVYLDGRCIQIGQVIIAQPEGAPAP